MRNILDPFRFVVIALAGWMNQKQQHAIEYLREENRVLREQLGTRRLRFTDDQRRRLAAKAKLVGRRLLNDIADLVTPDTLLAWHRKLIAKKYDGSAKRGPGRPRTANEIEDLVVRMAQENRDWGYRRILGAMSNLGHSLARGTIANILKKHGIEPAPDRIRKTTWKEFLSQHWELIVIRREYLDRTLFWTTVDLETKLFDFQHYYNGHRTHAGLDGRVPESAVNGPTSIGLDSYRWRRHCRGLYQTPIAA